MLVDCETWGQSKESLDYCWDNWTLSEASAEKYVQTATAACFYTCNNADQPNIPGGG